jgi:hypothetical protein
MALGIEIQTRFPEGDELGLAATVRAAEGPALIAWHHKTIPTLARFITRDGFDCPDFWPDDRFDLVWVLDRPGRGPWRFSQVAQRLLPHDSAEIIPHAPSEVLRRLGSG